MKNIVALAALALLPTSYLSAQEKDKPTIDVSMNTRFDFAYDNPADDEASSGFHGRYLNLMVKGNINKNISYSLRQRLNRRPADDDVFKATDWIHLTYKIDKHWSLSGGKQVVAIGGYEYDEAPINVYYGSMFWNSIACYQFGVSGTYSFTDRNSLMLQVCNSPYFGMNSSAYAYNLMWVGGIGCWSTLWSANCIENVKGHYATYIALGNRFKLGALQFDLDLMARGYEHCNMFDDYSIMAKAEYTVCPWLKIFAAGGYEHINLAMFDASNSDGITKKPYYGGGIELFPIKDYPNLRLHAVYNANHQGTGEKLQQFNAGATWSVNLYKK